MKYRSNKIEDKLSKHVRGYGTRRDRGFTIVELLIVIVVIGILAAITLVAYSSIKDRAEDSTMQADLAAANKELELYRVQYGAYPTSIDSTTYCPTPADTDFCLKASPGNTFANYTANNAASPQTFSLNLIRSSSGKQFYLASGGGASTSSDTFTMGAITGTVRTGSTVTAGALTPSGATATYKWQRSSASTGPFTDIAGATSSSYAIPGGDIGMYVRVLATGTGSYSGTATSAATAKITTLVTALGPISGTPTVGSILTAGAVTPSAATVSYQWRRAGTAIAGATASTYTVTSADVGSTITLTVTGTNNYSGSVTSAATATVN